MKLIAFTGAGISKSAGIPTFEDLPHLKEKLSVEFKQAFPKEFHQAINTLKKNVKDKQPTEAHYALANFQIPIITMNVDCLHTKAGSALVYELHGNYKDDNIVLYGQNMHFGEEATELLIKTVLDARLCNEEAVLLLIGTSMHTAFANYFVNLAKKLGVTIKEINNNADFEVPDFLNRVYKNALANV